MDVESARRLLLRLPNVYETMQWGDNLVFWVGDKSMGGKMFALIPLDGRSPVAAFAAGPEGAAELLEQEGFRPAPYLARAHWVAADRWGVLSARDWLTRFASAHAVVLARLPRKTRLLLESSQQGRERQAPPSDGGAGKPARRTTAAAGRGGKRTGD